MADIIEVEANITNHIEVYSTDDIRFKGEKLYGIGKVDFKVHNEITDIWKFEVKDAQLYRVTIQGANRNEIKTTCTCNMGRSISCLHRVASLLYILDSINRRELPQAGSEAANGLLRRQDGSKFELSEYEVITNKFVQENVSHRIYNQLSHYAHYIQLESTEITKEGICFVFDNDENEIIVKIIREDEKVFITSTEFSLSGQLTQTAAYCLLIIANSSTPDMLGRILGNNLLDEQKETLESFGLPADSNFSNYFSYEFSIKKGLFLKRTDESVGMLPVVNKEVYPVMSFINKTSSDELVLESLFSSKEKRELGFVLRLESSTNEDGSERDNEEQRYNVIPFIGKASKSGDILNTNIEEYQGLSDYQINTDESTKKLMNLLGEIDNDANGPMEFQLRKRAFDYVLKEKFVYGLKDGLYNIKKSSLQQITLSPLSLDIVFNVSGNTDFIASEMQIKIGDNTYAYSDIDASRSNNEICVINDVYYFVKNYKVRQYLANYPGQLKMVSSYGDEFFNQVIQPISKDFEFTFNEDTYAVNSIELDFNKKQVFLSEQNDSIIISPQVEYDNGISALLHSSGNILVKTDEAILEYKRNHELENDFVDLLADFHPNFESQKSRRIFYLHYSEFAENMWFYRFFDQLKANNVEVYGLKDLKNFKYSPYKGKIDTAITSGQDWFEVDVNVSFGDNNVSIADIRKAVINKQRYIQLKDGSVGVLPSEWYTKLEKYFRNGEIIDDKLAISKLKFAIVDELFENIDDAELIQEIADKRKKIASFTEISQTHIPTQVTAELRHYQKEGLNWLNFLDEMKWGGILADDMGLGKTLQILTFLQHLINKEESTNLIIVPTTLLFNWEKEIEKFTPDLKAFYHYGLDRQRTTEGFQDYHIVFTTYGLLLRDIEMLREFKFNYVILDESQAIKNPASRRFKAANLINANNRIALSGTPIENGTFDLFAQMSFANRGFFASAKRFKDNYSNPIDKDGNELLAAELQKQINPFILRRTKENVATELPAKTEDIIYCEMESEQRRVYDAYRNDFKNRLQTKISEDGVGKSKMMVLEALTRLRQICDSPALVNKDYITDAQSIKVKEILRHITNKTANHKILIFSQFVKMLSIVKDELTKLNVDFEYLDGKSSTKQRQNSVNNFQENEDLRVFLISLKAGGTGLNLTAADYVYILDPWWNPAVENQAIDRCYRIGQDKKVFAYRMICKDTVEEKILELQSKKKKIAGDIIQTDENIMKTLNSDDINDLFS